MLKVVIFDVDGTLIDSNDLHARAWQKAIARFGKEVTFEEVRYQIGKGGDQLMPVFFSREELERFGDELEQYRGDLFREEYLPQARPFPKVRELFERIREDGLRIALATSSKEDELAIHTKNARIDDLVDATTSADDAEKSKPHPDIFEAALAGLGDVGPEEALVVGDSPYDGQAAAQASLRIIGLLSGGFPEEELRAAGAVAVYRDIADLLERYEESPIARASANTAG
jgi:HAD superfamily hydrolase (TIGR01549 family)